MDVEVKPEPLEIDGHIKEEGELIIETEWLPIKYENEEVEYYKEFMEESSEGMLLDPVVKSESDFEQFKIENLDQSVDWGDNDYIESELDDTCSENDSDEETNDDEPEENSSDSKVSLYKTELWHWIDDNFIYRECPVCNEKLENYYIWKKHMISEHKAIIEQSESNYSFINDDSGICKKCNREFICKFSRYTHSATHAMDGSKINLFYTICKICNFNSKRFLLRKHILESHPEVIRGFKTSDSRRTMKCPICSHTSLSRRELSYHFMEAHPNEYNARFIYNCCLCNHEPFNEEETFLQHLIEKHELNSWKALHFRKIFHDKECMACTKCNMLFIKSNMTKLLRHFLSHNKQFYCSCKFCSKRFNLKIFQLSHMCVEMVRHFEKHGNEVIAGKTDKNSEKKKFKIKNLKEFESHITHVCPFCNNHFRKMLEWHQHLRTNHEIDKLKGLQMKVIGNDISKLCCTVCHTAVANSPQQLHEHRFLHLPYKPYECLFCSKPLNTFGKAITHFLKRCKDEDVLEVLDVRSVVEIECSYCNYQKFHGLKSVLKHYKDEHNNFENFFTHSKNAMICKVCRKKCNRSSSFEHLQHHLNEKSFKCKLCLRSYTTYKNFYHHFSYLHKTKPLDNQINLKKDNNEDIVSNVTKLYESIKGSHKAPVLNEFADFVNYACPECNEGLTSQENWDSHIETYHTFFEESNLYVRVTEKTFKCLVCNINLIGLTNAKIHILTHMPYKGFICKICNVRAANLPNLCSHFRRKHFADGQFKCPICSEVSKTEYARTVHLKEVHPRSEWPENVCLVCVAVFANKFIANNHMATHDVDRAKYTCDVCGVKLVALKAFTEHMERHKMRNEIKDKMVCYNKRLSFNTSTKSNASNDIQPIPKSNEFADFINYACPECNECVESQEKWYSHIDTYHKFFEESNLYIRVTDKTFKCLTCNNIFSGLANTKMHILNHMPYKGFICNICYVQYANFANLCSHFRKKHFAHGQFKCPICSDVSKTEFARTVHLKEMHTRNEWPETVCRVCLAVLANKFVVNNHMATHDVDRVKYTCDVCEAKLVTFKRFIAHMERHKTRNEVKGNAISDGNLQTCNTSKQSNARNDDNPIPKINELSDFIKYACPECNEDLTSQENWDSHIEANHNFFKEPNLYMKVGDRTFKCLTCKFELNGLPNTKMHILTHMPYKGFICKICNVRSATLANLCSHFRRKHFAPGKFKCPICSEVSKTEYTRTVHLKEIHPRNEWPETVCLVCLAVFGNKFILNSHMAIHNSNRVKYTCEVCGVKLVTFKRFTEHMEKHKVRNEIKDDRNMHTFNVSTESNTADDAELTYKSNVTKRKFVTYFSIDKKKK